MIATLLSALIASQAWAQLAPDSEEPIDITGESLEIQDDVATWTGNVRAVQGDAILTANRLIATVNDAGAFRTINATGAVRYANSKEAITGSRAVYDSDAGTITITGNVVVTQGKSVMTGGALVYWPETGRLRFTAPRGQRVRGVFHTQTADASL